MTALSANLRFFGVIFAAAVLTAATQTPKRLKANIDDSRMFTLRGTTKPSIAYAKDLGEVDAAQPLPAMSMHFSLTAAQQADLDNLLSQQQNRHSPQYHKFLTPEDYAARFGLNTADIEKVKFWLETNGFSNIEVARSRTFIRFAGTAGQAQAAFHSSLHRYRANGETHFANAADLQLPQVLEGVVGHIRGLQNYPLKPHIRPAPQFTSSISGSHFLAPDDFATIYDIKPLLSAGLDGTGVKIAIVGQSDVNLADLRNFRTASGLPASDPTIIIAGNGTDPGFQSGDQNESDLDLEWAGAIAKNASIIFVTADSVVGNGVLDSEAYAIDNNVAPILSISYGLCEADFSAAEFATENAMFQQASAQGITVFAASGDGGAADCDSSSPATQGLSVDFPASSPYVTGIGGTQFNDSTTGSTYWSATNNANNGSALSYIPESAWNQGASAAASSGGGASVFVAKPVWQNGTGVPADNVRDVPDLAFAAYGNVDGYLVCDPGFCLNGGYRNANSNLDAAGGTSAGTPSMASITALLVQKYGRQGLINANLYSLAGISSNAFHDITSGNNIVVCRSGSPNCPASLTFGYSTGTGYDQVTGLGSLDVYNFVLEWAGDYAISIAPSALTVARSSSGSATVTVRAQSNFSGNVTFTCAVAAPLTNVTCAIPGTVAASGTTALTITAGSTSHIIPWRNYWRGIPLVALLLALLLFLAKPRRAVLATAGCALLLVSCGHGSSSGSTPSTSETGLVTVTATSGQLVNTSTLTVTVP